MNLEQGKKLVKLARSAIFSKVLKLDGFEEKKGVFVTINSFPSGELRGCIGFTDPIYKLKDGVINAARHAAINDPRFLPVNKCENVTIEVSILSEPELIKVNDFNEYFGKIEIGRDGLIIEFNGKSGLLLPQVFVEKNVNVRKALEMTCQKAGLLPNTWKNRSCKVYKFKSQIFAEKMPNGEIIEKVK